VLYNNTCDRPNETEEAVKVPEVKFIFIYRFTDLTISDTATDIHKNNKHATP
jgi:hypothetical protein